MNTADSHFGMAPSYTAHSDSQKTIGQRVIDRAVAEAKIYLGSRYEKKQLRVLDVACGPGNLTCLLRTELMAALPGVEVEVVGLDYSKENIERLVANSEEQIQGMTSSFFDAETFPQGFDLVVSNEGLHWQPPRGMDEIIYSHLPEGERADYETWALANLTGALSNIHGTLKEGGVAVLQFGHQGQLASLWQLVREILEEPAFLQYKTEISFPLFYPTLEQVKIAFKQAGFAEAQTDIESFEQDLTEDTAGKITAFFRAFSEVAFSRVMVDSEILGAFYKRVEEKLGEIELEEFRKNIWHRTLATVRK